MSEPTIVCKDPSRSYTGFPAFQKQDGGGTIWISRDRILAYDEHPEGLIVHAGHGQSLLVLGALQIEDI